jgi:uncharacterized membrane protein
MNQLIWAIILTFLPVSELRGGMPLALNYAIKNNFSIYLIFFLIVIVNILVIFFLLFFLDFFHEKFLKINLYKKLFGFYLNKTRKRIDKFEARYSTYGYLALTLLVAIPFPTTGVWTGTIVAWLLGLDRKKSIISIIIGTFIAGIIVMLASLGAITWIF